MTRRNKMRLRAVLAQHRIVLHWLGSHARLGEAVWLVLWGLTHGPHAHLLSLSVTPRLSKRSERNDQLRVDRQCNASRRGADERRYSDATVAYHFARDRDWCYRDSRSTTSNEKLRQDSMDTSPH